MLKRLYFISLAFLFLFSGIAVYGFVVQPTVLTKGKKAPSKSKSQFQEGDIIFQSSMSGQSHAIQLATNSKYSHCGILLKNKQGELQVLEAVQPVKFTPIKEFIRRGDDQHYVVKRLSNSQSILTDSIKNEMHNLAMAFLDKDYDLKFEWSDEKMYCSELVWKIYERTTGLRLGEPQPLKSYSLDNQVVKKKMEERYGKDIPWNEPMVAPSTIFDFEKLEEVKQSQ